MGDSAPMPDPILRRLYPREEALLKRLERGEDTADLRAELENVRAAIRRRLRREQGPAMGAPPEGDDAGTS